MRINEKSAGRGISKLANRIRRRLGRFTFKNEFSGEQGKTLHFLLARPGEVFQKDIEEEYGIRPSTAIVLCETVMRRCIMCPLRGKKSPSITGILSGTEGEDFRYGTYYVFNFITDAIRDP